MQKINKKALSDIITTVLIILLALAAVILIWTFIKKPIEQGGQSIVTQGDCFTLQLKPTGCVYDTVSKNTTATVQWSGGDVDLQSINFIVTDGTGANKVGNGAAPSSALGTTTIVVDTTSLNATSLVLSAAGVIKTADGKIGACTETIEKLTCK